MIKSNEESKLVLDTMVAMCKFMKTVTNIKYDISKKFYGNDKYGIFTIDEDNECVVVHHGAKTTIVDYRDYDDVNLLYRKFKEEYVRVFNSAWARARACGVTCYGIYTEQADVIVLGNNGVNSKTSELNKLTKFVLDNVDIIPGCVRVKDGSVIIQTSYDLSDVSDKIYLVYPESDHCTRTKNMVHNGATMKYKDNVALLERLLLEMRSKAIKIYKEKKRKAEEAKLEEAINMELNWEIGWYN